MNLRAVETGGASLGKMLVHPDLKRGEPFGRPGCVLDRTSGGAGGPHNVPSANYVKLKGNQPSIGVKAGFLDHIDVINMKEKDDAKRRRSFRLDYITDMIGGSVRSGSSLSP